MTKKDKIVVTRRCYRMIQDKDSVSSNRERRYLRTNPTGTFRLNLTKFEHRRVIFKNLSKNYE